MLCFILWAMQLLRGSYWLIVHSCNAVTRGRIGGEQLCKSSRSFLQAQACHLYRCVSVLYTSLSNAVHEWFTARNIILKPSSFVVYIHPSQICVKYVWLSLHLILNFNYLCYIIITCYWLALLFYALQCPMHVNHMMTVFASHRLCLFIGYCVCIRWHNNVSTIRSDLSILEEKHI